MSIQVSKEFSRKVTIVSVWAMFSVIVIHSKALTGTPADWNVFIQWFFTRALSKWSVPFFFAVSGFWFAKSVEASSPLSFVKVGYKKLLKKKTRTLLVPYLLWAVIGMALCLPLICFNNYVTHRGLWERTVFGESSAWGCLNQMFGLTVHAPMGNAVLWYVRALLLFFVFAPVWFALLKCSRYLVLLLGLAGAIVPGISIGFLSVSGDWWGWILIGMTLSAFKVEEWRTGRKWLSVCGLLFVALCAFEAAMEAGWMHWELARSWLYKWIPLFGVPFFWTLYDYLPIGTGALPKWFGWTFWIYCIHAIFTSYFMAGVFFVLGKANLVTLATMFATPFIGLGLSIAVAMLCVRFVPRLFAILTGGRV